MGSFVFCLCGPLRFFFLAFAVRCLFALCAFGASSATPFVGLTLTHRQEEIAEARRKRHLNVLFLGMTRVAEYDAKGGLAKGMKRFDLVERMVREDVNEANMNPLR